MSDRMIIWNGLSKPQLDAAYNNMAAVADSAEHLAAWSERSHRLRQQQSAELDLPYGPQPRTRFDVFRCGAKAAPLLVFVHGGWWQRNSKEVFSVVAEGPMAHGLDVALLGYTLAPEATLREIAEQVHTGLDAIAAYQIARGGTARVILSGWSAGGHLTALAMAHPAVDAGLSISGVFDLEPIRHSYINDKLGLAASEVVGLSPAHAIPTGKPVTLAYGLSELPEMQRQSVDYATHAARCAKPMACLPLVGHNHFTIVEELARPDGRLAKICVEQAAAFSSARRRLSDR